MTESPKKFMLKSFSTENAPEDCHINAQLSIDGSLLKIDYELTARLADLKIPVFESTRRQRRDRLWEHTCFEIFLAQQGIPDYWEFNLSPSGDWNVYSFSGYREGMKPEKFFYTLPFNVKILSDQKLKIETAVDLRFLQNLSDLIVGLSAVIEQNNGTKSYWALEHPKDCPDFHARDGWG